MAAFDFYKVDKKLSQGVGVMILNDGPYILLLK